MQPSVLAVDDESEFLELERHYLGMHEIDVTPCGSALDAIEDVRCGHFDVVVSDFQMPGISGLDLLKTLRKDGYDLGFVLLTGKGREDVAIEALNEGADFYLQKGADMPTQFALLARVIDDLCAMKKADTARVEAENILKISNKRMDLLGNITRHDIRGAITIADGYLDLIDEETDPARIREHLSKVKVAVRKVLGIVEVARTYQINGAMNIKWSSLDSALEHARSSVDLHDVTFENRSEDWTILIDPLLEMVCSNILSNSILHGGHVTRIQVSTEERADGLRLTIEDDGVGIAPDQKEKVFSFITPVGIPHGLTIARRILEAEQIKIEEIGVLGEGAKFVLHFPAGLYRRGRV